MPICLNINKEEDFLNRSTRYYKYLQGKDIPALDDPLLMHIHDLTMDLGMDAFGLVPSLSVGTRELVNTFYTNAVEMRRIRPFQELNLQQLLRALEANVRKSTQGKKTMEALNRHSPVPEGLVLRDQRTCGGDHLRPNQEHSGALVEPHIRGPALYRGLSPPPLAKQRDRQPHGMGGVPTDVHQPKLLC